MVMVSLSTYDWVDASLSIVIHQWGDHGSYFQEVEIAKLALDAHTYTHETMRVIGIFEHMAPQ